MTDEQIIKAFECCSNEDRITDCGKCPYFRKGCFDKAHADAIALIKRQKAEIERLNLEYAGLRAGVNRFADISKIIRAEAIKEFAEKLKAIQGLYGEVWMSDVDRVRKEMEEST